MTLCQIFTFIDLLSKYAKCDKKYRKLFINIHLNKDMLTKSGGQTGFANPSITDQHDHNFVRFAGGHSASGSSTATTTTAVTHFSAGWQLLLWLTHYNGLSCKDNLMSYEYF